MLSGKHEGQMQYVVCSEPPLGELALEHRCKAFSTRGSAVEFAADQAEKDAAKASVYEIPTNDVRTAITAILAGEGGSPVYTFLRKSRGIDSES